MEYKNKKLVSSPNFDHTTCDKILKNDSYDVIQFQLCYINFNISMYFKKKKILVKLRFFNEQVELMDSKSEPVPMHEKLKTKSIMNNK